MIKLMLNLHKFNNYAFFCPVSRLHLTVSSPVGYANEVTPAILKALKAETVLDVDGVVDIETGTVKVAEQKKAAPTQEVEKPSVQTPEPKSPEPKKENNDDIKQNDTPKVEEPKVEEKTVEEKSKKGSKKTAKAEDAE